MLYRHEMPLWAERQNLIVTLDEGEESEQFRTVGSPTTSISWIR